MEMLLSLWLPILVGAVVLFFASFLAWAILPHHKPDVKYLPDEDALFALLKVQNVEPGQYMFPRCEHADAKNPEMLARYKAGPWGLLRVWPSEVNMGKNLAATFTLFLIITAVIGYLAGVALPRGAEFIDVFAFTAIAGVLAHTAGGMLGEVWFTKPLRAKVMDFVDGVVYGLLTGLIFALLWPGLPA